LTSDRKTKANRANARASTGPQTPQGRARAARNALRHALSLPVCSNPALSDEVEKLARKIAGASANAETQELARQVAEAQIDLHRVRYARHQLLSAALSDQHSDSHAKVRKNLKVKGGLLQARAPELSIEALEKFAIPSPRKFAMILSREAKQLLAMDRYERRAFSRRKFAMRAFDAARARAAIAPGSMNGI
jgi:hypothetical protein